jgi:hypothetical protein
VRHLKNRPRALRAEPNLRVPYRRHSNPGLVMMGQCFAYSCQIQDIDSALASSFRNGIASS